MRHRCRNRKLNRTSEHRMALRRNLAQSLVEHGQITTTLPKAKDVQPFFERLVTLAVKARRLGSTDHRAALRYRRRIDCLLGDRAIIPRGNFDAYNAMSDAARTKTLRMASGRRYRTGAPRGRLAFTAQAVTNRLIEEIAPRFEGRSGGYTRIIRLPRTRIGDAAPLAMVQLVGQESAPTSLTKPAPSARRRRANRRYAFAAKLAKNWSAKSTKSSPVAESRADQPGNDSSGDGTADS